MLFVDPGPALDASFPMDVQWDALGARLVQRGFLIAETRAGLGVAVADLVVAGDHMEADWLGTGDPDTYEGLGDLGEWLDAIDDSVLVVIGPGAADGGPMRRGWAALAAVRRASP